MKTVDQYKFDDYHPIYHDNNEGYDQFQATHIVLKKTFLLRKISSQNQNYQELCKSFARQANILKLLNHQAIYKCHKILKSKTSNYLIYQFISKDSFQKYIKYDFSLQQKMQYIILISEGIMEIARNNFIHAGLHPKNIRINIEENKIKIINFRQSQQISEKNSSQTYKQYFKKLKTQYTPPQLQKNICHINSDIYSFGKITQFFFQPNFVHMESQKRQIKQLLKQISNLVKDMIQQKAEKRLSIKAVNFKLKQLYKKLKNNDESLKVNKQNLSVKIIKTSNSLRQTQNSNNQLLSPTSPTRPNLSRKSSCVEVKSTSQNSDDNLRLTSSQRIDPKSKQKLDEIINLIIFKRSFYHYLIQMANSAIKNKQTPSNIGIVLTFLLLKKASVKISLLKKFLDLGRIEDYYIDQKMLSFFKKSRYYNPLQICLSKQQQITLNKFQLIAQKIKQIPEFSLNENLKNEIKSEQISQQLLKRYISTFLNSLDLSTKNEYYIRIYTVRQLIGIYLISLFFQFDSFEAIFQNLFSKSINILQDPFYQHLQQYQKQTIIKLIQVNIKKKPQIQVIQNKNRKLKSSKSINM